jgi:DhnA family fructose-bisphosphate aldolase class Ia
MDDHDRGGEAVSPDLILSIVALAVSMVCYLGVQHENRRIDKANAIIEEANRSMGVTLHDDPSGSSSSL